MEVDSSMAKIMSKGGGGNGSAAPPGHNNRPVERATAGRNEVIRSMTNVDGSKAKRESDRPSQMAERKGWVRVGTGEDESV